MNVISVQKPTNPNEGGAYLDIKTGYVYLNDNGTWVEIINNNIKWTTQLKKTLSKL